MNVERFKAIVGALKAELEETEEAALLNELAAAVNQLSADPSQEAAQQQVSSVRERLNQALHGAESNSFSPAWRQAVEELGIAALIGVTLAERLESVFMRNEITPATAAEEITKIQEQVQAFAASLNEAASSLDFFHIGSEQLGPGEFEIGFLIPRRAVNDGFEELGKEFVMLKRIVGPFSELANEGRPDIHVRSLSSSEFQVFLESTPSVALILATALERLIASYEKILNIRQKRQELAEANVPDEALEPISEHASRKMGEDIDVLVEDLLAEANVTDEGRRNELRNELTLGLNALAWRIDLGYNVDVRAGELPTGEEGEEEDPLDEPTRNATETVRSKQGSLQFMNVSGRPILSLEQPEEPPEQG